MNIKELLADKSKFKDDMQLKVGDDTFTLGDLRTMNAAMGGDLARQLEAERQKLAAQEADLLKNQEAVVRLYDQLEEDRKKVGSGKTTVPDDLADPFWNPVMKRFSDLDSRFKTYEDNMGKIANAIKAAASYYGDRLTRDQYNSLPADVRKELTFDEVNKIAREKRLLDEGGLPDVSRAYEEWNRPRELERMRKQIEKEAYEKAQADIAAKSVVNLKPGTFTTSPTDGGKAPAKDFGEAFQKGWSDPDIQALAGLRG